MAADPSRRRAGAAWLVTAVALAGCATVDPTATVEATSATLAERGVNGVAWPRVGEVRERADERVRALLAAPLTPEGAAEVALLQSPSLEARLAELGVAQADLAQATRLANPGVSFSRLTGGGHEETTVGLFGDVVDWLTQPLRRKLAEAELERVKLEIAAAILDQVSEAKSALVELQAAEELVARLDTMERIDRAAADYAAALHAAGNLTQLERDNARASWGETKAELERERSGALRRREAVIRALGLAGAESWTSSPFGEPPPAIATGTDSLEATALANRLDLAAARWAVDAVGRARRVRASTRWFPVGVELGVERERKEEGGGGVQITGPTVELALPIFDGGGAALARLDAELARARAQVAALESAIRSEVRASANDLATGRALAEHYRDTVLPLRRSVLELTLREYNQMVVGTFDVLIAKKEATEAERRSVEALAAAWQARFELDRALGTLVSDPVGGQP